MAQRREHLRVVSLLKGDVEKRLRRLVGRLAGFDYSRAGGPDTVAEAEGEYLPSALAAYGAAEGADVILVQLTSAQLKELDDQIASGDPGCERVKPWLASPAAVIAVLLPEESLAAAVLAARLDFDGIIALPVDGEQFRRVISRAIDRHSDRRHLIQRHSRLRRLCASVNRNRRQLRDKVNLLCGDLVEANRELTETMHHIRRAYDLQSSLVGEFDLHCLLHKGLRHIQDDIGDTHTALYLCRTESFEGHVVCPDQAQRGSLLETEGMLGRVIVADVLASGVLRRVDNAACECKADTETGHAGKVTAEELSADGLDVGNWDDVVFNAEQDDETLLAGLSLVAAPLIADDHRVGVLVMYRWGKVFTGRDVGVLKAFLRPLSQAIDAAGKLAEVIG